MLHHCSCQMWSIFICIFLFRSVEAISSIVTNIPVIHNVSLQAFNYNSTTINGTCDACLCAMLLNTTEISCFNCFSNNNTCEIFSKSFTIGSFSLINNSAASVYFLLLPINEIASTIISTAYTTSGLIGKSLYLCVMHIKQFVFIMSECENITFNSDASIHLF
jgi:hypothetical protein